MTIYYITKDGNYGDANKMQTINTRKYDQHSINAIESWPLPTEEMTTYIEWFKQNNHKQVIDEIDWNGMKCQKCNNWASEQY